MKNFVAIERYGKFYDPTTNEVCPMKVDGTPDNYFGVIDNVDDLMWETPEEEADFKAELRKAVAKISITQKLKG